MLAEACTGSESSSKTADAMGPLLSLLETCADADKARCGLQTLRLLATDRANRLQIVRLNGGAVLLTLLARFPHHACVRAAALDAVLGLVKGDGPADTASNTAELWPSVAPVVVELLSPGAYPLALQLDVLSFCQRTALAPRLPSPGPSGAAYMLMEPRLLPAVSALLHPCAHPLLLARACLFLGAAASDAADREHVREWHYACYQLVPLLTWQRASPPLPATGAAAAAAPAHNQRSSATTSGSTSPTGSSCSSSVAMAMLPCGCALCVASACPPPPSASPINRASAAIQVLLALSDRDWARNALFAAGAVPPLLSLIRSGGGSGRGSMDAASGSSAGSGCRRDICHSAACALANLAECALARGQLTSSFCLAQLLCALRDAADVELVIGVLYVLGRLAAADAVVCGALVAGGAQSLLQAHAAGFGGCGGDADVALGARQLLLLMGCPVQAGAVQAVSAQPTWRQQQHALAQVQSPHSPIARGGGQACSGAGDVLSSFEAGSMNMCS
ncbi:hypothetical protein FOA52_007969 [Chlamydomonas sp. UWO 241]|nr:hypothetical protein FOA52_007969 [Chlamydomonas sp. UWO 241]